MVFASTANVITPLPSPLPVPNEIQLAAVEAVHAQLGAAAVTFTAWPLLATAARMVLVGVSAKVQPAVTLKIELPVSRLPVRVGDGHVLETGGRSHGGDVHGDGRRVDVGDGVDGHTAADRRGEATRKSGTGIEEPGTRARGAGASSFATRTP